MRLATVLCGALVAATSGCGTLLDAHGNSGIKRLGPDGGVVDSDFGVRLVVPPGALNGEVTVMLVPLAAPPSGVSQALEVRPLGLALALPAVLTFRSPGAGTPKVALQGERWLPVPGRLVDADGLSSPVVQLGRYGLVDSTEVCTGGVDDDGDGLVDCADPVCAGAAACQVTCTSNADCACGAICAAGACSEVRPRFCATSADCTDVACAVPTSHGATCGYAQCARAATGLDGGTTLKQVSSCLGVDDQCSCESCLNSDECPGGTHCLQATHRGGKDPCAPPKGVCL